MEPIDQPIRSVAPLSGANLIAAYSAISGWAVILYHVVDGAEGLKVHVDFPIPFLNFYLDFHVSTSGSPLTLMLQVIGPTLLSASAGWLIGFVWAFFYNVTSKYLGVRLKGRVGTQETSHASGQPAEV
jgi:hypothetical protein